MAITAFSQWSATAALNIDLNSIPLDGAVMTAGQVDDAFREMMAQLVGAAASTTAAGFSEYATTAEWRTGTSTTRSLVVDQVWSAGALVTLTDAATIAVDMSTFLNASVTLGGNRALGAPSNTKVGQSGVIYLVQDGTGSRTLSFNSVYKFAFGSDPVLSTAASSVDALHYFVRTSTFIECSLGKGLA
jgi:hypothetical protein